jgi:hypothetical protein
VTPSHILFIPGVALLGMFLGFILGARAAKNQFDLQLRREEERVAARAARAAKAAAAKADAATAAPASKADPS